LSYTPPYFPKILFHQCEQRFALFDNVGRQFRPIAASDVLYPVDHAGRDEEDIAGIVDRGRPALDVILERPLDYVNDLLAGMRVRGENIARVKIDAYLDSLVSGRAQIMPLQLGPFCFRLMWWCGLCAAPAADPSG
jgi:hypothetical protein